MRKFVSNQKLLLIAVGSLASMHASPEADLTIVNNTGRALDIDVYRETIGLPPVTQSLSGANQIHIIRDKRTVTTIKIFPA